MKKSLFLIALLTTMPCIASDLDVLIAKTALALGDEYSKLASNYQTKVASYLSSQPEMDFENEADVPVEYLSVRDNYHKYKNLALAEYSIIFCNNACLPPNKPTGLEMADRYNFLRREAFTKHQQLGLGSNNAGTIGKISTIYAVTSSFEDHLLGKLTKLVEVQQRLDVEARKLSNTMNDLQNSYVDLESEQIVGVTQSILNEQNYSNEAQTQLSSYESCITSEVIEDNFERDELKKSLSQLDILQKNVRGHMEKAFDSVYQDISGQKVATIKSNLGWQQQLVTLGSKDRILISATGAWNFKGAVEIFEPSHLDVPDDKGLLSGISKGISSMFNSATNALGSLMGGLLKPKAQILKAIAQSNKPAFNRISTGLECKAEGYLLTFSEGLGNGISEGTGASAGVGYGYFDMGVSSSSGSSSSVSSGIGGTYTLKLTTTTKPQLPLGALLGSFCDIAPSSDPTCEVFLIGAGTLVEAPNPIGSKKLWLIGNDGGSRAANTGSLQVILQKQATFKSYWDEYYDWYTDECDTNGFNCGLGYILENIAYTPNPYAAVKASFTKQFPNFPDEVSNIILQQINYMVEMNLAEKEIKTKELSRELHSTKIATCKDQAAVTLEKVKVSRELMSTFQRRAQTIRTKEMILDTSRKFYEQELAAINTVRLKNIERIKRYYALTVSSYNYLYLDNFRPEGESQPYFEGDFYKSQVDLMEDLISEITAVNDLLNLNRGFVVYQLSNEELQGLTVPDYRLRKSQVKLDHSDFFCQGFDVENQARVMIDKVGILLDIDPAKEHLFFKNPHKRNTQIQLAHGLENIFYGFDGSEKEQWMPSQKRNIAGYSTRVLTDANSDYFKLRDTSIFERLSFRKTSFASTWQLDMTDPSIRMYEDSDTSFTNSLLKGLKLVFWFNSTELQGDSVLNKCLTSPVNLVSEEALRTGAAISWSFPKDDIDFDFIERFTVYRSTHPENGFKPIGHVNVEDCGDGTTDVDCAYTDSVVSEGQYYYQVRSAYRKDSTDKYYLNGVPSTATSITLTKTK